MIVTFWILAAAMCLAAVAFILVPLYLRGREASKPDRTRQNVDIYEERLAELEEGVESGATDEEEFEVLKAELQKNLLDDTGDETEAAPVKTGIGRLPIVLAVLVPLFALFAYSGIGLSWGAINDVQLAHQLSKTNPHDKSDMSRDVARLAEQLKSEPDNDQGWFLLAQSYMDMELYDQAAKTFQHLIDRYPQDYNLSSYYMQAVYLADKRVITPRVQSAIDKALKLNPHDVSALEILAMDAYSKSDFTGSLGYFRKALVGQPDKQRKQMIEQAIAGIEKTMKDKGLAVPPAPAAPTMAKTETAKAGSEVAHRSIDVLVEVGDDVNAPADASVFVFARAEHGPPMPLAVQRLARNALPKLVKLDDTMGMMKGMSLADFDKVEVIARISSSGIANASPDDYEARSSVIDLTKPHQVIKLKIEHRRKELATD